MTRLKLIPWLAMPALLLVLGAVIPTAMAATAQASTEETDGMIYAPLDVKPAGMRRGTAATGLQTSLTPGEVTIAQHGLGDQLTSNINRFLAVRFDPPFDPPYTISKVSFPYRTNLGICVPSPSASSKHPGAIDGTSGWSNPDSVFQQVALADDKLARVTVATGQIETQPYKDFSLNVPSTAAQIVGIQVHIKARRLNAGPLPLPFELATSRLEIRLHSLSSSQSGSKTVPLSDDGANSSYRLGGTSDAWGPTWTAADLSDQNFRLELRARGPSTGSLSAEFGVDAIEVHVFYILQAHLPTGYESCQTRFGFVLFPAVWTSATRATTPIPGNDDFASATVTDGEVKTQTYHNFSVNGPNATAQIVGIEVDIRAQLESGDPTGTLQVRLRSLLGAGKSVTKTVPVDPSGSIDILKLGDGGDTWGASWVEKDFYNQNFRLDLVATGPASGSSTFRVDALQLTVHYIQQVTFRSIRLTGMNPTTGRPDLSQTILINRLRRLPRPALDNGQPGIGIADIPVNHTVTALGKTFFLVFHFPGIPQSADSFPFVLTDRQFTERGLFANSYTTDSTGAAFNTVGAVTGTGLLADQNLNASMTCVLSSQAPLNAPSNLGLNLRDSLANWTYVNPPNILADGSPAPGGHLFGVELVRRQANVWAAVDTGGAGAEKVTLPGVPGSGMQIWGVRSLDMSNRYGVVSNVTITGSTSVVGYPSPAGVEDAQEANGIANESEATSLTPPISNQSETLWPAGDQDNYVLFAQRGQVITATCVPSVVDFRNDMELVVNLIDHSGDAVESGVGAPGATVMVNHTVSPPGRGNALRRFFVQVMDKSGSPEDPASAPRVLIPAGYKLSVDVTTPGPFALGQPQDETASLPTVSADEFAFANAGANPVRGHATFGFVIPRSQGEVPVKLRIYDVRGRLMSTLVNGTRTAGTHFAAWSGHDVRGNRVSSGAYFARLEAGSFSRTIRIDVLN